MTDLRGSLAPLRRAKFEAALKLIEAEVFAEASDRQDYQRKLRDRLDGMSADDVIAHGVGQRDEAGRRLADGVFDAKRQLEEAKQAVNDLARAGQERP
jgi:hypothetical protein